MAQSEYKRKKIQTGLNKLQRWAESKGYYVDIFGNCEDYIDSNTKEIHICSRQTLENQLYGLVHECGHLLIHHNRESYKKNFPLNFQREIHGKKHTLRSKRGKVDEIAEEIEAWRRGKSLMKRLGIWYDEKKFDKLAADCVFTYVETAVD